MKRFRGCLGVVLIFGFGLLVGGFFGAVFGWVGFFHKVTKGGPGGMAEVLFQRAKDDLGLDGAQQQQVRAILKETSAELAEITAPVRPSVESALVGAEGRLRAVLKPKQQRKFDGFMNEVRRRWRKPAPEATKEALERTEAGTR